MARLKKRGRIYYAWIPRRDGATGTELVSTRCTDKQAAEKRVAELERQAVDPTYAAASAYTTQDLVDDYVRSRIRMKRAEASVEFTMKKGGHLLRLLPAQMRQHTHAIALEYIDARQAEGVANTTILKELRVWGGAWKLALRNGKVLAPWETIKPELDDDHEDRDRWMTPLELVGLATILPRHRMAAVAFSCATGCDPSALFRVQTGDVAKDYTTVHIRGTKRRSRLRDVPIPLPEQRTLLQWAVENADNGIGGRLFSAWPNLRNDVAKACETLGIPRCSPNDWRRTYAKWLRMVGVQPQLIGAAMGHADSRMIERVYGRLPADALAALLAEETARYVSGTRGPRAAFARS